MKNRDFIILMHTHWDREWYFTKEETQVLLNKQMLEVLDFLEANEDVIYVLDGQSVMLDDFVEINPNHTHRIKKLVKEQRLLVGPWYTQTDLMIVHGESIIRNLYYGIKVANDYGNCMYDGYAPDTFGHNGQMPQIYKQSKVENSFFWRGFSELKANKSDFVWEGVDGSKIFGINLATGYQGAKYLEEDIEELTDRMKKITGVLDNYSASNARLIMNGHDQMPIQTNIKKVIENLKLIYPEDNVQIGSFQDYISHLKQDKLEIVQGELVDSKHARIHKTINSTRMDIKLLNSENEYKIFNVLEPLMVYASNYDIEYPHVLFEKIFKIMFGCHAHDSIGCCNSDEVNEEVLNRLKQVKNLVDTQIELTLRMIAASEAKANAWDTNLLVFNPIAEKQNEFYADVVLYTRKPSFEIYDHEEKVEFIVLEQEIVEAGQIDRQIAARLKDFDLYKTTLKLKLNNFDGLSIKNLSYVEKETEFDKYVESNVIENEFYKVVLNDSITLIDKVDNKEYENFIQIENNGDGGDTYDYSPIYNDWVIDVTKNNINNFRVMKTNVFESIKFNVYATLPTNEDERTKKLVSTKMSFEVVITLTKNSKLICLELDTENKIDDSRFRAVFNCQRPSNIVSSDMQLCQIDRPTYNKAALDVWESEKWSEKPISIETYNSYVTLGEQRPFSVITMGLKEYEIVNEFSSVAITMWRSIGQLGRRELINRPGRPSGIEIPTPLSQTKAQFKFKMWFGFDLDNVAKIAKQQLVMNNTYQLYDVNKFQQNYLLNKSCNKVMNLELKEMVISAFKCTEAADNLFIRMFNPTNDNIELTLENAYLSNNLEEKLTKVDTIIVKSNQIVNIIKE